MNLESCDRDRKCSTRKELMRRMKTKIEFNICCVLDTFVLLHMKTNAQDDNFGQTNASYEVVSVERMT